MASRRKEWTKYHAQKAYSKLTRICDLYRSLWDGPEHALCVYDDHQSSANHYPTRDRAGWSRNKLLDRKGTVKIIYEKNKDGERNDVDLFVIGQCLALVDGPDQHRIGLTQSQWALLAESATRKANGD